MQRCKNCIEMLLLFFSLSVYLEKVKVLFSIKTTWKFCLQTLKLLLVLVLSLFLSSFFAKPLHLCLSFVSTRASLLSHWFSVAVFYLYNKLAVAAAAAPPPAAFQSLGNGILCMQKWTKKRGDKNLYKKVIHLVLGGI